MTDRRTYLLLSTLSGACWGGLVTAIAFDMFPHAIWGGLLASPLIGGLVGAATRRWGRLSVAARVVVALLSLYAAAALFGLGVGLYDGFVLAGPDRITQAVVAQAVVGFPWGLTFLGLFIVFWPLAYLNHWIIGRFSETARPLNA